MLVRVLVAVLAGAFAVIAMAWFLFGPFGGPPRPPPRDKWEALLRERIKIPGGYHFEVFARDLGTPRLMQMTARGDFLVSGYQNNNILLVRRDADGDGRSDGQSVLKDGMHLPHGLLLEGNTLYVAEESRVLKYDFDGVKLINETVILDGIPEGGHASRTIKRGPDGFLYLAIGSSCNACVEDNPWRAAILRFKDGGTPEIFASGLRNTVGFGWQPETGALYGVDNGRDQLGDDVPDDEVNRIEKGLHYGWPFVHGAGVADPELFAKLPPGLATTLPAHGLGAHVAPLSITFLKHQPGATWNGSALVAEHGSWNRSVKSGYRIVRLVFTPNSIHEEVFLSGCVVNDDVICRPVDALEGPDGSLYVTDDYAGAIYRIGNSRIIVP